MYTAPNHPPYIYILFVSLPLSTAINYYLHFIYYVCAPRINYASSYESRVYYILYIYNAFFIWYIGVCPLLRWRTSVFTAKGVLSAGLLLPVRTADVAQDDAADHRSPAQSGVRQSLVLLVRDIVLSKWLRRIHRRYSYISIIPINCASI